MRTQSATAAKTLHCTHQHWNKHSWTYALKSWVKLSHFTCTSCKSYRGAHITERDTPVELSPKGVRLKENPWSHWWGVGGSAEARLSLSRQDSKTQLWKKLLDRKQVFCSAAAVDKTGRADWYGFLISSMLFVTFRHDAKKTTTNWEGCKIIKMSWYNNTLVTGPLHDIYCNIYTKKKYK